MKVEVLVAAMNQKDFSLVKKMNIKSDAIIANQCDRDEITKFDVNGNTIRYLSFNEKGVGLNRNNALMRANGEICVIADDDMVYCDNYVEIINNAFNENKEADMIIFNIYEKESTRFVIKNPFRVRYKNFMRFGAARIAFRRESIIQNGIFFNLNFGGGAKFSAGEDTLFLKDCLSKGLKIVAVPEYIAKLTEERESTWFKGYNDKYFYDKGVVYGSLSKWLAPLLCIQYCLRNTYEYRDKKSWDEVFKIMLKGAKDINK